MRKVSIQSVQSGARLGKTIFNPNGLVLLGRGIELNDRYIRKLEDCGVTEVYIEDALSEGIEVEDVVADTTRNEAKKLVTNVFNDFKQKGFIGTGQVTSTINSIVDQLLSTREIMVNLTDIKTIDDYTFSHSVNVAILSIIAGMSMGFNQLQLRDLGIGAILHDMGKIKIPDNLLKKPGKLTNEEFEIVKQHTTLGHEIIRKSDNISIPSAIVSLLHHERFNGSGYPYGMKGDGIHLFARIVSIADTYDAMTSDRVYRAKLSPSEAVEYLRSMATHEFDPAIVETFVRNIAVYPVGSGVVLSNREKGIVTKVYKQFPERPVVRIVFDENGNRLESFREVDLTKIYNIVVSAVCEL